MPQTNIDISSLSSVITEFRNIQAKDAITPESLGAIMQRIADLLATAGTSELTAVFVEWYEAMRRAQDFIYSLSQNGNDRNDFYISANKCNPITGALTQIRTQLIIPQATTEHSGVMRAQQVTDLNTLRNRYNDTVLPALERLEAAIAAFTGTGEGIGTLQGRAQIAVEVLDGELHVYGASKLLQSGYVPYLFRHTRRRNRNRNDHDRKFGKKTKGWHLYGSMHSVSISNNVALFNTNVKSEFHMPADNGYSPYASTLVAKRVDAQGHYYIPWGRSVISLYDTKTQKERMLRLRFAIGFALPVEPSSKKVNTLNLVSNLAEFSVVYNPKSGLFVLSR